MTPDPISVIDEKVRKRIPSVTAEIIAAQARNNLSGARVVEVPEEDR